MEGIIFLKDTQETGLIKDIMRSFISENNITDIIDYYKGYVTNNETYLLEFNVNSKASSVGHPIHLGTDWGRTLSLQSKQ